MGGIFFLKLVFIAFPVYFVVGFVATLCAYYIFWYIAMEGLRLIVVLFVVVCALIATIICWLGILFLPPIIIYPILLGISTPLVCGIYYLGSNKD